MPAGATSSIAPDDETYWSGIAAQYDVSPERINLENGFFGVPSRPVLDAMRRYEEQVNRDGTYFMRIDYPRRLEAVKQALAEFTGVSPEELLITRNVTEAMNILLQGYGFRPGDEVIHSDHEYESVLEMLEMTEARRGIRLARVELPLDPQSDEDIVALYERAITPKTRAIVLTHVLHRVGQILPVAKIAHMARSRSVDVIVDAAHSFAQLDYRFPDLHSDFVAVNLHKWLGAPLGTGLLYIRQARIPDIARLYGESVCAESDIRKLARVGTTPPAPVLAIADAIAFHNAVGSRNKEARLRYLKDYWVDAAKRMPHVEMLTPSDSRRSCAIAAFRIHGMASREVADRLLREDGIFSVAVGWNGQEGVRITPHLYNTPAHLDRLISALRKLGGQM
jgi:selenocysteine lyase/cysteine desulfurase